jgi:hypothetical protein
MEERRGHGKKFIASHDCGGSRGQHLSSHRGKFLASNWMGLVKLMAEVAVVLFTLFLKWKTPLIFSAVIAKVKT